MKLAHHSNAVNIVVVSLPPQKPALLLPKPSEVGIHEAANSPQKHVIMYSMIILACLIGAAVLLYIIVSILRVMRGNSTRSASVRPQNFGTEQDFLDEDQGPEIDHPIWYINTIGLQQSVIDSIAVFRYKKDEGLIEGTECSVCLNEFEEDESLRLLPKCSHAFHIACIDTWLRSHKNCPLCRAPIVSGNFDVQVDLSVPASVNLSRNGEPQVENSENDNEFASISNLVGEDGNSEIRNGYENEEEKNGGNLKGGSNFSILGNHSRILSDLVDRRQNLETEMEPMRRSASLDSSSAIVIYSSVASLKHSTLKNAPKQERNGSGNLRNLMKSYSMIHTLQKVPVSMKRSISSRGKSASSSSSHGRILPL